MIMKATRTNLLIAAAAITTAMIGAPSAANARAFYVNNKQGSNCSDSGAGTVSQPWCSFTPVNANGPFAAGDSILLARGAVWNEHIDITGTGSASAWITLGAYGTGDNPKILRNQGNNEMAVRVTNPDYWVIEHLEVGNAALGIIVHMTTKGHRGLRISDIYAHDIKGIARGASTTVPFQGPGQPGDPWANSVGIAESAGVVVTTGTAQISLSSKADFILKDIGVSLVRGTHNNNTLSFINVAYTPDGEHSSGYQDIDINAIDVVTDDGHIAPQYRAARLGCANSVTIAGAARVRLHDSTIFQGAACYTEDGTASLYLAFVEDLVVVNNTFVNTPFTGSNDSTAIDYEWFERNVSIRNNYFAAHAGPGVEILNIHAPDFVTTVMDGNTFSNNNIFRPRGTGDGASVHQGGTTLDSVATLSNNLYTEPNRPFFYGDRPANITQVNNLPTSSTANYAGQQFSPIQGANQWRYQYQSGTNWIDMSNFLASFPSGGAWYNVGGQYVGRTMMAPIPSGDVARVWVAPHAGTVSVRGRLMKADVGNGVSAGNGITGMIQKVSGSVVTQVWPATGGAQVIAGADGAGVATQIDNLVVAAGDQLRFVVGSNGGDNAYDTVSWTPSIGFTSAPTRPYNWTFETPTNYEGWAEATGVTGTVASGALILDSTSNLPFVATQNNLNIPASVRYMRFRLRNQTGNPTSMVFFTTTTDQNYDTNKAVTFTTATNATGYTDYVVDMGANARWTGTIKQIRFVPFLTTGRMMIDSVSLGSN